MAEPVPLIPSATVVVLRDGPTGIEALLVRRRTHLTFGGAWVFPGGRVDEDDRAGLDLAHPEHEVAAARAAAVREATEEIGVTLDPDALVRFSYWTPPETSPKRFGTHFFVTRSPSDELEVVVDGDEADDWRWFRPIDAMDGRDAGAIDLRVPTWITLEQLHRFDSVADTLEGLGAAEPEHFATRLGHDGTWPVALYHGDAGYEASDGTVSGSRHRLVMADAAWRYDRDGWPLRHR